MVETYFCLKQNSIIKRILLISDTHSHTCAQILEFATTVDEVWHAGDIGDLAVTDALQTVKPVRAVYGNIDDTKIRKTWPLDLHFEIEGLQVWMTHIGGYPGKYVPRVAKILDSEPKPGLFICGHSHVLKVIYDHKNQLLHMNPGACGVYGFHAVRTALRFEIDAGKVKNLEVIELAGRK